MPESTSSLEILCELFFELINHGASINQGCAQNKWAFQAVVWWSVAVHSKTNTTPMTPLIRFKNQWVINLYFLLVLVNQTNSINTIPPVRGPQGLKDKGARSVWVLSDK